VTPSTDARTRVPPDVTAPAQRLLDGSLVLAPLAYLAPDRSYAVGGWDDGATAAPHIVAAALYGLAALGLVSRVHGRTQAVLLVRRADRP